MELFETKTMDYINLYFIYLSKEKRIHITKKSRLDLKNGKINYYNLYRILMNYHKLNNQKQSYRILNSFQIYFDDISLINDPKNTLLESNAKSELNSENHTILTKFNFLKNEMNIKYETPEILEDLNGLYFLMFPYTKQHQTKKSKKELQKTKKTRKTIKKNTKENTTKHEPQNNKDKTSTKKDKII